MRRLTCILPLLLSSVAQAGQPTWKEMQSQDFHVYSTASDRDTQAFIDHLERVRSFFAQFTGSAPQQAAPVTVVIFGSPKEYQPYRLNSFATAYYSNHTDRDFIVIGVLGEQSSQTAAHEYTHLVFRHGGYTLPPWLNEGLAEVFSTIHATGKDIEFGEVIQGRLYAVNRDPWVPMETIVAADQNSPYYNETSQAGSLYNQSWAFVHMLMTNEPYRSKFGSVVLAISNGTPSVEALEKAYGMPFAQLEKVLVSYIRGDKFYKMHMPMTLSGADKLGSAPANMFDVREVLAELLAGMPDRKAEARTRLEELAHEDERRPEPWANLGYLSMHEGKREEAGGYFAKAYALGSRNPQVLLEYAQLMMREKPEDAAAALDALLVQEPGNTDARLMLGYVQLNQRDYPKALETVRTVKRVETVEQRDQLLLLRALAELNRGHYAEAREWAEQLLRATKSADMRQQVESILSAVNRH
jgi:Tfp pilus assembly protein PilF